MNIQEPVLDWPSASELWTGTMAGSGSSRNPDMDQPSISHSRHDVSSTDIPYNVLIVEDDDSDLFLIQEALGCTRLPLTIQAVKDGEQAIRFFDMVDADPALSCPALVILDINLPKRQGGDVLENMRQSRRCASAPVIVVSTSESPRDRQRMASLGANRYFRKPSDYEEFMKLGDIARTLLPDPAASS
jgi:CheY-like chemotaxis protein